ncbi:MBL fold metallo-hydrolase [Algibacter amylolyticus]|uniref:MBL fold metallo-hydrolase n=1 Tax=Algibacter amylolyticus TaxID=1608400 RepID=A0A5M7BJS8_9FLAO|nr:MBL fold metallo-hydrolase [Algibacter amylolyticus]KAA5827794.1 MBL fold metallo-hydrolase [Algibacter amylolyticus]MBB5267022.1 glyoxylase-like metal-dependent hydrolase (beta-lactamase superfamily II) [Algibacter amylolyticus]TSJ82039.1 MBL fold metallo-hydrolase [Algibacter amylolyticus]
MRFIKSVISIAIFGMAFVGSAQKKEFTITTHQLTNNIYMLEGQGGNIGISIGEDGVLMIDSQFAPLTPKILAAIKRLSDKPIAYLANTHHHGDHTGGNENIAKLQTPIIAHDNVYRRIKDNPKQNDASLPVITFNDKLSLYINGEQVLIFHVDNAHTDGDAMLYFTKSNVLHTGDTFFNERYPYIDLNSGGSINGYINAVKSALILIDEETKIIPGHGNLSNKAEYSTFLNMMESLKSTIEIEISQGKTEDEVAANSALTKTYDDLNYGCCFISSEKIRRTFYKGLKE